MNIHRIVIATAGVVSFSLGWNAFAQTSEQSGSAPESQTTSQEPADSPGDAPSVAAPADGVVIIQIQKKLASEGYDPGATDGVWGPQTEAAVRNFQRDQDMDATGQLDADTIAIILAPVESGSDEAAGGQGAQPGGGAGAPDQQSQGGSGATEGAAGQSSQGGQQPPNRQ